MSIPELVCEGEAARTRHVPKIKRARLIVDQARFRVWSCDSARAVGCFLCNESATLVLAMQDPPVGKVVGARWAFLCKAQVVRDTGFECVPLIGCKYKPVFLSLATPKTPPWWSGLGQSSDAIFQTAYVDKDK